MLRTPSRCQGEATVAFGRRRFTHGLVAERFGLGKVLLIPEE
jgi:hypothetical protein